MRRGPDTPTTMKGTPVSETTEGRTLDYREASLDDLSTRAAELRSDLMELHEGERNDEYGPRMSKLLDEVRAVDNFSTLRRIEFMNAHSGRLPEDVQGEGPSASTAQVGNADFRSLGDRFLDVEGVREWLEEGGSGKSPKLNLNEGIRASVFDYGSGGPGNDATGAWNKLLPVAQPIAPTPRQANLFMRSLIPVQRTTFTQVPYVRELNPVNTEGGASAVAEGDTKPDQTSTLEGDTALITVLAANFTLSKQVLADASAVVDYINNRLPYLIRVREDQEILAGSGTWPDIKGIKNFSGLQTGSASGGAGAWAAGIATQGIAKVELVDLSASAVVMNPTDAWAMFTNRASSSGVFDAANPFTIGSVGALTVWGLPVKRSRVYASGSALVGDFANSAILFDRESTSVQMYDQHSDYPAKNLVLVQAEERIGLAVTRPDGFVSVTLGA